MTLDPELVQFIHNYIRIKRKKRPDRALGEVTRHLVTEDTGIGKQARVYC